MNLDESAGTKVPIKPRRRKCPPLRSVPVAKRSGKRGCLAGYWCKSLFSNVTSCLSNYETF